MENIMKNDLAWEHDQHYSDEWENLADKCSKCHAIHMELRNCVPSRESLGTSIHQWKVEDYSLNPNPLDR